MVRLRLLFLYRRYIHSARCIIISGKHQRDLYFWRARCNDQPQCFHGSPSRFQISNRPIPNWDHIELFVYSTHAPHSVNLLCQMELTGLSPFHPVAYWHPMPPTQSCFGIDYWRTKLTLELDHQITNPKFTPNVPIQR